MSTKNFRSNNPDIPALCNVMELNTGIRYIYFAIIYFYSVKSC